MEFDYVIVGAGSAGCVLADRLSRDGSMQILLIESGPEDRNAFLHVPLGLAALMKPGNPHYWEYKARQGEGRAEETWIKGRTLGGSSSVNGMVYVRGAPLDYDGWERAGCKGWGWRDMLRAYREIEDHALGASDERGAGGPLSITLPSAECQLGTAILDAASQAGFPTVQDNNGLQAVTEGGFGWQPRTISKGRRVSASVAFLKPARRRPNLTIWADSTVERVMLHALHALHARGVVVRTRAGRVEVAARREVILCAGALHSPQLLQLSGIGPAPVLAAAGIPILHDLPGVGENMREHRGLQLSYRVRRGGHNRSLSGLGLVLSAIRYASARRGVLANAVYDLGGFVKSRADLQYPDAQIGIGLYSFAYDGSQEPHPFGGKSISPVAGFTMYGCYLRPRSCGTIKAQSPVFGDPPAIIANYMAHEEDRSGAVAIVRQMRRIVEQPALQSFEPVEVLPAAFDPRLSNEAIIEQSFRFGTPGYHVCGTCRMGNDPLAVVDPDLRVRGVVGLRVVDTSIFPTMPSGNTNGPAIAAAWLAADRILKAAR